VPLHAPLTVYFSRVMDRLSVARAWRLTPSVPGTFRWTGTSTTFTPAVSLRSGAYYRLTVYSSARAENGVALSRAFSVTFSTGDTPRIQSFTPANGTAGVAANGLIAVTFNHPMVALAGLSAGIQNPAGWNISISPHLAGYGNWLGTSTWVFHPASGLEPSTRYTVTVDGQARDAWGEPLGRDVQWSFGTVRPEVYSRSPRNGTQFADPRSPVTVTFNQPMARAATAHDFSLSSNGIHISGRISWQGNRLIFHPSVPLNSVSPYDVRVLGSARSSNGRATLGKTIRWRFRSAPSPRVIATLPEEGARAYDSAFQGYGGLGINPGGYGAQIDFSAPMNKLSLDRHLTIAPAVPTFDTYFGGPDQNGIFSYGIYGQFKPSSSYTITLAAGVHDQYGRPLPGPFTLHFKTARLRPSIALYGSRVQATVSRSAQVAL
jgi:Bacterial Ig-like domain